MSKKMFINQKALAILAIYTGDYSASLHGRKLARKLKSNQKTISSYLNRLGDNNILRQKVVGKNKHFLLNKDNAKTKFFLMEAEIYKTLLFLDKYPGLMSFVKELSAVTAPILVFGSFSRMAAGKTSDLDVLVVSGKGFKLPEHLVPHKLHKIQLNEKQFMRGLKNDETLLGEIFKDHVIINNHSFFMDRWWEKYAK